MKTLHTWQCPVHGVMHTFRSTGDDSTDVNATRIAVKATEERYAAGCPERVRRPLPDGSGYEVVVCGERVTHMAGEEL